MSSPAAAYPFCNSAHPGGASLYLLQRTQQAAIEGTAHWVRSLQLTAESHAICILGVSTVGGQVIYRDPNLSSTLLTMPFSTLQSKVYQTLRDPHAGLLYYNCPRCRDGAPTACIHDSSKRLAMKAAEYPAVASGSQAGKA